MAKFTFHNSGRYSYFTLRAVPRETDGFYPTSSTQITLISGSSFSDVTSSVSSESFGSPFVRDDFKWAVALPPGTSSFVWPSGSTETATTVPASESQMAATGEGTLTIGDTTFNLQDLVNFSFVPELVPGEGGSTLATASNAFSMNFVRADSTGFNTGVSVVGTSFNVSFWVNANGSYTSAGAPKYPPVSVLVGTPVNTNNSSIGHLAIGGAKLKLSWQGFGANGVDYSGWGPDFNFDNTGWNHVSINWVSGSNGEASRIYMYVNGKDEGLVNYNGTISTPYATIDNTTSNRTYIYSTLQIGYRNTQYFDGIVDEVAVFTSSIGVSEQTLDASTIESIYSASLPLGSGVTADLSTLSTPPVAWYRMGD